MKKALTRLPVLLFAAAALLLIGGLTPVALHIAGSNPVARGGTPASSSADQLSAGIAAAQARLRTVPGDWSTWGQLGAAYVEQARVTADPTYYGKADGALHKSLELHPTGNVIAMAGMGALANARHDFSGALDWGHRAEAVDPASGSVHGVLVDALTQLGAADDARVEMQKMLDVQPGVASFTRASYDFELHGQVDQARDALQRALATATDSSDIAFCHYYLGELAFNGGDPTGALTQYQQGLTADPTYEILHAGLGKADMALGRTDDGLREYDRVVSSLPLPNLVLEYGDALTAADKPDQAAGQYQLFEAQEKLFAANGVNDHLGTATYLADHGNPAGALTAARTEWTDRQQVLVADALGWALYRTGQDTEALRYSTKANALGWRNATFLYHRGAIEHALGDDAAARRDLTDALSVNRYFDILQAPVAEQLLASLGGTA